MGSSPGNEFGEIEPLKCVHLFVGHLLSYNTYFLSGSFLQAFLCPEKPTTSSMHPVILAEVMAMAMLFVHHITFFNLSDHITLYINNEFKADVLLNISHVDVPKQLQSLTVLAISSS